MSKLKSLGYKFCVLIILASCFVLLDSGSANAQTSTTVKASVGKYYLTVSGYASPFASIVMSSNSIFMASTVADPKGNFLIQRVLVNEGFTDFCLEAVDVKRIGDSFTCFKIPPVSGDTKMRDIFLPPTMGLSGKKIAPGSSVFASGYSMPNAKVIINISKDIIIETKADASGFYKVEIKDLPVGKYKLFATARYDNRDSEKPNRTKDLESTSLADKIKENFWKILLVILLITVVIILIFILLSRRLRQLIRNLLFPVPFSRRKKKTKGHHSWFIGY